VALKTASCGVWQRECQASNVTASVQSDHLLHRRPPGSTENYPTSQQAAAASRLYRGLLLGIHALLQHAPDAVINRV